MVAGGLGLATPAGAGNGLACGTVVTESTVLQHDIGPCTNNGIVIGADNITLDLNDHHIFGRPPPATERVYLQDRTIVTVRNGQVSDFDMGVAIVGGSHNAVRGINAHDNIGGLGGTGGDGIAILSSPNNRIQNNRKVNNGPFAGIGVYSRSTGQHPHANPGPARDNIVDGNYVANDIVGEDRVTFGNTINHGIKLENDGAFNAFTNNNVLNNGLDGISMFADTTDNNIRGNSVHRDGRFRTTARRVAGSSFFTRSARNLVENTSSPGTATAASTSGRRSSGSSERSTTGSSTTPRWATAPGPSSRTRCSAPASISRTATSTATTTRGSPTTTGRSTSPV